MAVAVALYPDRATAKKIGICVIRARRTKTKAVMRRMKTQKLRSDL